MSELSLFAGDNRESLRRLIDQGVRVHSVVTDPPYVMESVLKRFGKEGAAPAQHGRDGAMTRSSSRFIGKTWDASEIAWDVQFWGLLQEIMLPGAFCFAFAGPRTLDRQMHAMRSSGMVIYPLHAWSFSTGLPKGHPSDRGDGWYYGAATPKVDFEPVILAQRPIASRTFSENIKEYGVGDMNMARNADGKYPSSVLNSPKSGKDDRSGSLHPSVKPVNLLRDLIRRITPPGGTVLDPFAGSGTTAEAARREGFDCILMEAEPEYVAFLGERFPDIKRSEPENNHEESENRLEQLLG